jgi:predicted RNA-binding Zn ribbon-like protein
MDALLLNPGTYPGTYKLVGGEPSLDLINTVSWPGTDREHDWFDRTTNVTLWAVAAGLLGEADRKRIDQALANDPSQSDAQLAAVRTLRAALRDAIAPRAAGETPARVPLEQLDRLLHQAFRRRRLDPGTLRWTWLPATNLEEIMAPVVWNAGRVLTEIDHRRLGLCPSCDWLFHDTTRNRSRRWCDMGDCGSRDKALRYYHRHKLAGPD